VFDHVTHVTQGGQTRTFVYDSLSRLTSATSPEGGTVSYSPYDNNGNLLQKTDARAITTTYAYDRLNRLTDKGYIGDSTPPVTIGYDSTAVPNSKGRLTSVTSSISSFTHDDYDPLGRVKATRQTTGGQQFAVTYTYDLWGNLKSQTYPSGRVVSVTYDAAGRASEIRGQKTAEADRIYAASFTY